jgi:DNA polymerase-3 subunit delta
LKVAAEQAHGLSMRDLETLLEVVADAEYWIKTGRRDAMQALEWVVMTCTVSKRQMRRAR